MKKPLRVIFILGMHRSGTSAMAGALEKMGMNLGHELMPPGPDNLKGFFEHSKIHKINEQIFQNLNTTWDTPFFENEDWIHLKDFEDTKTQIRDILWQFIEEQKDFVLKDPRFSLLLPIWTDVAEELELDIRCLVMMRPPLEIAASLFARNHFNPNKSFLLYNNYLLHAERNTRSFPRVFVQFEDLIAQPQSVIQKISKKFEINLHPEEPEQKKAAGQFVDRKLKHFEAEDVSHLADYDNVFFEDAEEMYEKISGLEDQGNPDFDGIDDLFSEFVYHFDTYYRGLITKKLHFASMYFSENGEVFSEKEDVKISIFTNRLRFTVPREKVWKKCKFYPSNSPSYVILDKIKLTGKAGTDKVKPAYIQSSIEHGNQLLFKPSEFMILDNAEGRELQYVDIHLKYEALGENVIYHINKLSESVNTWFYNRINALKEDLIRDDQELKELLNQFQDFESRIKEYEEDLISEKDQRIQFEKEIAQKETQLQGLYTTLVETEEKLDEVSKQADSFSAQLRKKELALKELETGREELRVALEESNQLVEEERSRVENLENSKKTVESDLAENLEKMNLMEKEMEEILEWKGGTQAIIDRQHQEIQKFKVDYAEREKDIREIKGSVSYQIGYFLTWPFRFGYNLIYGERSISSSSLFLYMKFILIAVSHPVAFVRNFNAKNIQTLRKALKTESPQLILGNFRKRLAGKSEDMEGNSLEQIETMEDLASVVAERQDENEQRVRVLYISPNLPDYDESSGGKRATKMLELIAEEYDVYAYTSGSKPQKHIDKLNECGVIVLANISRKELKRRLRHFDVIIFAWYYTIFTEYRFIELFPEARVIIDSVDVHWVREERSIGIWEGITEKIVQNNKEREKEAYEMADIVWAVTENDRDAILKELPGVDVRIVSNIHSPVKTEYRDPGNNTMLFIGGYNHYPNVSAAKLIAEKILPVVRKEISSAELILAGSKAPQEIIDLGNREGVQYRGFIPDSEMETLYANSFLSVCPLLAGAGIKGKICEAISYMTPVVTNSIGNEGINLENGESGIITDDYEEMSQLIVKAMKRKTNLREMAENAQKNLYDLVGEEVVKSRMVNSIRPVISICIVTWNRMDLLKQCIESIEGNTNYPQYKILVHSNGCTDGTQDYLRAAARINPRIVPILSDRNDVFVIPNNRMMMKFPDNDVVLLNNDTTVTENWLNALHEAAYLSKEVGIAGSKILFPDGRLQEFGSELYEDGTGRNIGKWEDPNQEQYRRLMRAGYVSGCAMYIKRSTINLIGVFDEQFHPCYCEDSDYCYTAWEQGIQTVVTPYSVIYHDEGGTSGTDTSQGFKKYQEVNFKKFLKKHKKHLKSIESWIGKINGQYVEENV